MKTLTEVLHIALNEHLGVFEGLRSICEYCSQEIFNACNGAEIEPEEEYSLVIDKEDLEGIPNVFFNKINFNIEFEDSLNKVAEYIPISKIDNKTLLFRDINVNVFINS